MKYKQTIKQFLGMVTVGDLVDAPQGSCADQQNVISTPTGALSTRAGFVKFTTSEMSGSAIGIYGYRDRTDTIQILSFTDNGDIVLDDSES